MKKIAFIALLATTAFTPALAADLGAPVYKAPVAAPAYMTWNGFYIGANGGLAAGDVNAGLSGIDGSLGITSRGAFGGGQIGYNWQYSPNWVFGVEADIQGGSIKGSVGLNVPGLVSAEIGSETTMWGTVRGRLGYANGNALYYVTGGYAWGRNNIFVDVNGQNLAELKQTHSGWTVGAGAEYAFAQNWSAKVEYLYVDLGKRNYLDLNIGDTETALNVNHKFHVLRVGVNYRFGGAPIVASY